MIGIKSIASYVPASGVDNYAQGAKFSKDEEFILGKIGSAFLPRKDADQETSDLCVEAVNALFSNNPQLKRESIDALIVVTQNGDAEGLPHTAAIVQDKLGLPTHVAAFDISLGCSGYVYGIYAMKGFMEAAGLKNGLLVTADPYSKIVDPEDRNTTMLFGDAATATWMGEDAPWQLGKAKFGTDGSGAPHLKVSDGVFFMNGRQVFNFALLKVPAHLNELLEESELTSKDIDAFCIHQGSAAIVDAVARRF
jgi:3-oxoacyl-[acyl-carrier-protein] synthase III